MVIFSLGGGGGRCTQAVPCNRCLKGGRRCWEYVRLPNKGGRVVSAGLDCHLLKVNCETTGRMESVTST